MFELNEPSGQLVAWLWEEISEVDFSSFYDAFSRNAKVASYFKRKGYQVLCSDILQSNYWWSKALVENNEETLTPDFLAVLSDESKRSQVESYFQDWSEHYFLADEVEYLSLWWHNINYSSDFSDNKKSLAYVTVYLVMNYWLSFNKSYLKPKPMSPNELLSHYSQYVNSMVYNNEMPNKAYYTDAYSIVNELTTDVALIYPPSQNGFRNTDLRTYLAECWTRRTPQINLDGLVSGEGFPKLGESFDERQNYQQAIINLLERCAENQLWLIGHHDQMGFDLEELETYIRQHRSIWKKAQFEVPYPTAGGTKMRKESLLMAVLE